ncbi:hypothetical protein PAEH1_00295 [Paenalcaligenes hominis]|uniref:Flagellin C-terminal domain-containing protein n=1 Tax=Paenalcaligenes hominis TaxID=643674 RepID=A0A1U9JX44_9BURK|nr:hypothetical protein PAEH1_00295 [Paenalcaligenes hominis]
MLTTHWIVITEIGQEIRLRQLPDPIAAMDRAIAQIATIRRYLGAIQNRFKSAISSLTNTATKLSAARSRTMDVNYATEVSSITRAQIVDQASTCGFSSGESSVSDDFELVALGGAHLSRKPSDSLK